MPVSKKNNIGFIVILIIYCLYALVFIERTSFVIDGTRYFSLFDDAMISMRYAKNLVHGVGLVWNPGDVRVEGYTNPLWVYYMAFFHLLPLSAAKISLGIQLSGMVFLILTFVVVKKVVEELCVQENQYINLITFASVILTAFYLPLNNWSLQGMEVSILTLMVSIAMLTVFVGPDLYGDCHDG